MRPKGKHNRRTLRAEEEEKQTSKATRAAKHVNKAAAGEEGGEPKREAPTSTNTKENQEQYQERQQRPRTENEGEQKQMRPEGKHNRRTTSAEADEEQTNKAKQAQKEQEAYLQAIAHLRTCASEDMTNKQKERIQETINILEKAISIVAQKQDKNKEGQNKDKQEGERTKERRLEHSSQQEQERTVKIFFSNITVDGPTAQNFLKEEGQQYDAVGMVETHRGPAETDEMLRRWKESNFKAAATPAKATGRSKGGTSGGAIMGIKTKHQATSLRHLALKEDQQKGMLDMDAFSAGPIDFEDFAMMNWRIKDHTLTVGAAYLTDKMKFTGRNLTKLSNIATAIQSQGKYWILLADWNMEPQELTETGWPEAIGGEVLKPKGGDFTCSAGKGAMLDYAVISKKAQQMVISFTIKETPWGPHQGLVMELAAQPEAALAWRLPTPARFDHPKRGNKPADPDSKKSWRNEAQKPAKHTRRNSRQRKDHRRAQARTLPTSLHKEARGQTEEEGKHQASTLRTQAKQRAARMGATSLYPSKKTRN